MINKTRTRNGLSFSKKIIFCMIFSLATFSLFSESDNGKFLPSKEPFSVGNIYLQIEPLKLQFPMLFLGLKDEKKYGGSLTSVGYAGSGEIGYNWSGWLFGSRVGYSYYKAMNDEPLIREFQNLTVSFNLSRVISSRTAKSFPDWFGLTPFIGLGADMYQLKYYKSHFQQKNDIISTTKFGDKAAFFVQTGLQTDFYFGTDYAIPFVALEGNIVPDKDGMSFFSSLNLGIRMYPFSGLKKNRKNNRKAIAKADKTSDDVKNSEKLKDAKKSDVPNAKADISFTAKTDDFTPDGDGKNDTLKFVVKAKNISKPRKSVKSWDLTIYDPNKDVFKKMTGKGLPPKKLTWDGKGTNGEAVVSAKTYRADMNVYLSDGRKLTKSLDIETGILVRKDKNGVLRIEITSISFDPSAATFNKLSAEKIASNEKTLRDVAKIIKRYKGYKVTVEGHANPTSRGKKAIARENKKFLIPLSQARAEAIKQKLIELGVSEKQLTKVIGMGGSRLIAEPFGKKRWMNRRVEFILTKN